MALTQKQENFCLAYVETGNASEAYRRAYDAENMQPETIWKRASELLAGGEVAGRVHELRRPAREAVKITLKDHLETMQRLRDGAEGSMQYSAAIKAEECRAKASGIYTAAEEDERAVRNMSKDLILSELKQIQERLAQYAGSS